MPDTTYPHCADCDMEHPRGTMYEVHPPHKSVFYLCDLCWNRMVDLAAFQMFR